jgi:tetratricopeptide (TPR) repeat protein
MVMGLGLLGMACKPSGSVDPSIAQADPADPVALYELLEQRIAAGTDSEADRNAALEQLRAIPDDETAASAYVRAAVVGRVAEGRGLKALELLEEMQTWALLSIERDPNYRDMAATRMLGTLYVLAGQHLADGDSEQGLELLEDVVDAHPDAPTNHLRLAEGYIALGDPEPAYPSLCLAQSRRAQLSGEEQRLLDGLLKDIGDAELGCAEGDL